jgi:tetratricopeptide (TPR) repeat protein/tRNA A-37 threonylcarbamoyl transferase component Bud32
MTMTGQTISHYLVGEKIGEGGMGEVYLAEDLNLKRRVALKVLPPEVANDAERIRRFEEEAQTASALSHPNILVVYEIGGDGDLHFMASEYIEGENLAQRQEREPLTLGAAVDVAARVADALAAAHKVGITHRDIKAANIMVAEDGRVKVIDFGLAKLSEKKLPAVGPEDTTLITPAAPGSLECTVPYVSPELLEEKGADERSDIWSLGVCLYEMLARRSPFLKSTLTGTIASILKDEPAPLGDDVPEELSNVVMKALRKNRGERHQTAEEFRADLLRAARSLEGGKSVGRRGRARHDTASRENGSGALRPEFSKRRVAFALVTLVVVAVASVAGYMRLWAVRHVASGRESLNERTADGLNRAKESCERATSYDPWYAPAYVCLADVYALKEEYDGTPTQVSLPVAESYIRKALRLDGESAEAYATLGFIMGKGWRWAEAEAAFKHSIELNPRYPRARHWYCMLLRNLGRHEESHAQIEIAHELDPSDRIIWVNVVISHIIKGETDAAVGEGKALLDFAPKFWGGRIWTALARLEQGPQGKDDAISDLYAGVNHSQRSHTILANFGYAKAFSGDAPGAEAVIKELEEKYAQHKATGQDLAKIYAGLGRADEAFEWLEKDYDIRSGDLPHVGWHPSFKNLRRDPRFAHLMQRMGIEPAAVDEKPPLASAPLPSHVARSASAASH